MMALIFRIGDDEQLMDRLSVHNKHVFFPPRPMNDDVVTPALEAMWAQFGGSIAHRVRLCTFIGTDLDIFSKKGTEKTSGHTFRNFSLLKKVFKLSE